MIIKNFDYLSTSALRHKALMVLNTILEENSPSEAIARRKMDILERVPEDSPVRVFGFGKASYSMYIGLRKLLDGRIVEGTIIVPEDEMTVESFSELQILRATHPFPSESTLSSSLTLVKRIESCSKRDVAIFLISGGGSSLFEIPTGNFSIEDLRKITKCVMDSGASIDELNRIRIALSSVKGGKLLEKIRSRDVVALYISDVVSNDLRYVSSGPLIPQSVDLTDLRKRYGKCFANIDGKKLGVVTSRHNDKKLTNIIVLSNRDLVRAAISHLGEDNTLNLGYTLGGDVKNLAEHIIRELRKNLRKFRHGFWFVGAGEPTVHVKGTGRGGRNQELCLHVLKKILPGEDIVFLSAGTDGIDGNSDAMGGIVDRSTLLDSSLEEIEKFLRNNDSYGFLSSHRGAIMTGRTGNNVSDVFIGYFSRSGI